MDQAVQEKAEPGVVEAPVNFVVDTGDKPVTYLPEEGLRDTRREGTFEDRLVPIRDGRPIAAQADLDREGFRLLRQPTAVTDFYDDEQVRGIYYPEMERVVKDHTGAARVVVFDHTIRAASERTQSEKGVRDPVHVAHNDYTEWSAPQRVRDLLPEEAEDLLKRRFAIVQTWRPIAGPVLQKPLAICDARSIAPSDLIATDLVYKDRPGEVLQMAYDEGQRWYYIPRMTPDELLVFKCYDSLTDGRARFTAHTAFDDPTSPPDAPERVSIEIRTLAFF